MITREYHGSICMQKVIHASSNRTKHTNMHHTLAAHIKYQKPHPLPPHQPCLCQGPRRGQLCSKHRMASSTSGGREIHRDVCCDLFKLSLSLSFSLFKKYYYHKDVHVMSMYPLMNMKRHGCKRISRTAINHCTRQTWFLVLLTAGLLIRPEAISTEYLTSFVTSRIKPKCFI